MIAIEYSRYGGPEVIELREVPVPQPQRGEVLVRVHAAALNPKDALVRAGKFKHLAGAGFPKRMGYDLAGVVADVGSGVSDLAIGQRVFGMIQSWQAGAFAEFAVLPRQQLAALPDSITFAQAAAIPLAGQTALQALRDLGQVGPGSRVVIHGASGGVGTLAVQLARWLGAEVTALCGPDSAALVASLGADSVFDYHQTAPTQLPGRYDCFFDVFGNQHFAAIKPLLHARGSYVSTVPNSRNIRNHALTRFWPGRKARLVVVQSREADLKTLAQAVSVGQLRPLIAARFPLAEMRQAHVLIATKRTHGKIIFELPFELP